MNAPPAHLLIAPLPFSVRPAPHVSVSLPLSSVISIWCILAAVVGSLFSMCAGLTSVLWWQMRWLISFHGIINILKSFVNLDVCLLYKLSERFKLNSKGFCAFCFSTAQSATQTPTQSGKLWKDLHLSLFFFFYLFFRLELEHSLHANRFEWWWGHWIHMWVATCVGRLISLSLASGLLKGSGFGSLLHLSHITSPLCLLALEDTESLKGNVWVDKLQAFIPYYN